MPLLTSTIITGFITLATALARGTPLGTFQSILAGTLPFSLYPRGSRLPPKRSNPLIHVLNFEKTIPFVNFAYEQQHPSTSSHSGH